MDAIVFVLPLVGLAIPILLLLLALLIDVVYAAVCAFKLWREPGPWHIGYLLHHHRSR
jgi:hypothetical protein